jgi:hypothetical protein
MQRDPTPEEREEERLDRLIAAASLNRRLKKKRARLQRLQQDGSSESEEEDDLRETKRTKSSESAVKIQLPTLRYKGQTQAELNTFLFGLEARFTIAQKEFKTGAAKVIYASSCLDGPILRRWTHYATNERGGKLEEITWEDFQQLLRKHVADEDLRRLTFIRKMKNLQQSEHVKVESFIEEYERAEAEDPDTLPEVRRASDLLACLAPSIRQEILRGAAPRTRQDVISEAKRIELWREGNSESLSRNSGPKYPQFQPAVPNAPPPAAYASGSDTNNQPGGVGLTTDQSGERGRPRVPLHEVECYSCRNKGHFANRCPVVAPRPRPTSDPATNPNTLAVGQGNA